MGRNVSRLTELARVLEELRDALGLTPEELEAFLKVLRKADDVDRIKFVVGDVEISIRRSWSVLGKRPLILEITQESEGKKQTVEYDLSVTETKKFKFIQEDWREKWK